MRRFGIVLALAALTLVNLLSAGFSAYNATLLNDGAYSWFLAANTNHQVQMQAVVNSSQTVTGPFFTVDPTFGFALPTYTVAGLPACNAGAKGALAVVTDGTAPTYNATAAGAGAVNVPVMCDGTNWKFH